MMIYDLANKTTCIEPQGDHKKPCPHATPHEWYVECLGCRCERTAKYVEVGNGGFIEGLIMRGGCFPIKKGARNGTAKP